MADPINPRLSGPKLLKKILRENPHLTRTDVLAIASLAGFDLLDLKVAQPPDPGDTRPIECA